MESPGSVDVVDRTNAARPDIICILGDLVIQGVLGGRFVPPEEIATELGHLRAPAGVVGVLGNHDGWFDHDRVRDALERAGIRLVEDTAARLDTPAGPVWVAGISDRWAGRHDLAAAMSVVKDDGAPVLLLTHNPDVFPLVPNRVTLTLAGHTHGGQVRLPLAGPPIVPSLFGQRFAAGHVVEGGRHLFVATGVGTSILPVRFLVPPEVTILTLVRGGTRHLCSESASPGRPVCITISATGRATAAANGQARLGFLRKPDSRFFDPGGHVDENVSLHCGGKPRRAGGRRAAPGASCIRRGVRRLEAGDAQGNGHEDGVDQSPRVAAHRCQRP